MTKGRDVTYINQFVSKTWLSNDNLRRLKEDFHANWYFVVKSWAPRFTSLALRTALEHPTPHVMNSHWGYVLRMYFANTNVLVKPNVMSLLAALTLLSLST